MIGEQIENNINKEPKSKIHLIVSVLVIVLIVILFAVFMRLDLTKPAPVSQEETLTPQERGAIIDKATKDMEFSTVEERSASVSNVNIKGNQEARMRAVNQ
jgi:flagellar biosynthesis/type III secretory pathway M-ring protein FliF/YscJ